MKHIKRIITIFLISIITIIAVFVSYIGIENGAVVFAEDINYMSDAELEAAYQAYLQSKGGGFIGNAGARLTYTTGKMLNFLTSESNSTPFENLDEVKGLMSWQKAELESGNSSVLQLAMSPAGRSVFSLYTQWLLQNHYFGNGVDETDGMFDDGTDNNLYSGEYFSDDDGNTCLVYIINNNSEDNINYLGTTYKYTAKQLCNIASNNSWNINETLNIDNSARIIAGGYAWSGGKAYCKINIQYTGAFDIGNGADTYTNVINTSYGNLGIGKKGTDYYLGWYFPKDTMRTYRYFATRYRIGNSTSNIQNVDINFYTNNNNNITVFPTVNADGTLYITPKVDVGVNGEVNYQPYTFNQGDTISNVVNNYYTDSGTKDKTITIPSDQPTGGGDGGGGSDGPTGGNPPNWNNPFPHLSPDGDGGFDFNFTLPDLNIDWNISGLTEKFPFSIPFDLLAFCRVLDAEPETPQLTGQIDLKIVTWDLNYDLHAFDDIASLCRNLEFISFCIALIIATRNMIKG